MKDLSDLVSQVSDESSFLEFLFVLAEDWEDEEEKEKKNPSSPYGPGANGWENGNIGSFLEAAAAWGEASQNGLEGYEKTSNIWRRCAEIIHMGKLYE